MPLSNLITYSVSRAKGSPPHVHTTEVYATVGKSEKLTAAIPDFTLGKRMLNNGLMTS